VVHRVPLEERQQALQVLEHPDGYQKIGVAKNQNIRRIGQICCDVPDRRRARHREADESPRLISELHEQHER
jgi:hypothetical protein